MTSGIRLTHAWALSRANCHFLVQIATFSCEYIPHERVRIAIVAFYGSLQILLPAMHFVTPLQRTYSLRM